MKRARWLTILGLATGAACAHCTRAPHDATPRASVTPRDARSPEPAVAHEDPIADAGAPAPPRETRIDPDGNDDVDDSDGASVQRPLRAGQWERVGKAPLSLQRICDLTAFQGKLYAAHANQPLGTDGATITRFDPHDSKAPFSVAFDWNRFGEPTKGGGGGQGFLRVHKIGGRLFVADADPPYGGLGAVDWGTEGYVFVSDAAGRFAPARAPHAQLPVQARDGGAGVGVAPRAYHDLDVVRFRGKTYMTTGSVPPKAKAWNGPSPGALHVANEDFSRWTYAIDFPFPYDDAVWRLTYGVRFRDRLYVGLQDYEGRSPYDYVQFAPPPDATELTREHMKPVRITERGAAHTLRWFTWQNRLYWIAWGKDGVALRVTDDGDSWRVMPLPEGSGVPTDVRAFRGQLVVLTERATYALGDGGAWRTLATVEVPKGKKKTPFSLDDVFCAAPLGILEDTLYAGAQNDGALYRFVEAPPE